MNKHKSQYGVYRDMYRNYVFVDMAMPHETIWTFSHIAWERVTGLTIKQQRRAGGPGTHRPTEIIPITIKVAKTQRAKKARKE